MYTFPRSFYLLRLSDYIPNEIDEKKKNYLEILVLGEGCFSMAAG